MQTTTYICDHCKQSVSKDDLVAITIGVKNLYFDNAPSYGRSQATVDICKGCMKNKGFVIETITKENSEEIESKNTNTLKAKIIDILYDLDVAFVD